MPSLRHLLLYAGFALVLTQLHGSWINHGGRSHKRLVRHAQILRGTGDAPWGYRVGTPYLVEGVRRAVSGPLPAKLPGPRTGAAKTLSVPMERGYLAVRFGATFGFLALFHTWMRRFGSVAEATAGTAVVAALHGPSYANYWFQPASAVDGMLWMATMVAVDRDRDRWVPLFVLLGAVNRETALFMVLLYGAMRWGSVPLATLAARCVGLGVLWVVPQAAIRWTIGPLGWAGNGSTPLDYLTANLTHPDWLLYAASFLGVMWLTPALMWRSAPPVLKRLVLVLLPYVVLQLLFGRIREVRLFLPLVVALVPLTILWLREPDRP